MAGTIIGTPDSPPTVDADWNKVISNYVVGGKGQNSISLTEWTKASSIKPAIVAGSTIEVNGSFAEFTATVIGDDGSLVTGTIYLYIDVTTTPGDALPKFTNTVPTWDDAKGGFYNGNNRYTGHTMEWNGTAAYTLKGFFLNDKGQETITHDPDGGIKTDNIFIKTKYITGTLAGSGTRTFAHGLGDKVRNVLCASFNSVAGEWQMYAGYGDGTTFLFISYDDTNIVVESNSMTNNYGQGIRFIVTYETT